jgi:hypothetical protein
MPMDRDQAREEVIALLVIAGVNHENKRLPKEKNRLFGHPVGYRDRACTRTRCCNGDSHLIAPGKYR